MSNTYYYKLLNKNLFGFPTREEFNDCYSKKDPNPIEIQKLRCKMKKYFEKFNNFKININFFINHLNRKGYDTTTNHLHVYTSIFLSIEETIEDKPLIEDFKGFPTIDEFNRMCFKGLSVFDKKCTKELVDKLSSFFKKFNFYNQVDINNPEDPIIDKLMKELEKKRYATYKGQYIAYSIITEAFKN